MIVRQLLHILMMITAFCDNIDSLLFRLYHESVTSNNQEAYGLQGTRILHGFYAIDRLERHSDGL